nr:MULTISPECIES: rubrerythrin family protein [Sphingomonas]
MTAVGKIFPPLPEKILCFGQDLVSSRGQKPIVVSINPAGDIIMNIRTITSAALLFAALVPAVATAAPDGKPLAAQTRQNLEAAMKGEAYANLKYLRYADQAEAAGNPELATLFRNSANVEANEHFDREAQALELGSTAKVNLEDAIAGEHYENTKMYIDFAKQAEASGDVKVAAMFRQIAEDEGTHLRAYRAALAKTAQK